MLHKFRDHVVSPETRILLLGTFHPDIRGRADFFYSLPGNSLWRILAACFDEPDLTNMPLELKKQFMKRHGVDFADIIASLKPDWTENDTSYGDELIDFHIGLWKNVEEIIDGLPLLEGVYFTRKTFGSIPAIETRVMKIRNHCVQKGLRFCLLDTPARFSTPEKVACWKHTILDKITCR